MARLRLLFVVAVFAFATCGSCGFEFEEATIDSI
jgi:predicted Zn-ribbon and HTH transcriptional regulator